VPLLEEDRFGLNVLDEPSPFQSDPSVVDLQLRSLSKRHGGSGSADQVLVRAVENADKNPREISKWIASIADLHKSKPPPQVFFPRAMPDVESLMREWPADFERLLSQVPLPTPDIDMSTDEYARMVCALLDVPVYSGRDGGAAAGAGLSSSAGVVHALHIVFTLFSEFRANQHFAHLAGGGARNSPGAQSPRGGAAGGVFGGATGAAAAAAAIDAAMGNTGGY
jgi:intraflagellar transport protein 46